MIDWSSKNIDISKAVSCGEGKKTFCPQCHDQRKPCHRKERELFILPERGWFKCYNCGWQGFATVLTEEEKQEYLRSKPGYRDYKKKQTTEPKREYKKPPKPKDNNLLPSVVEWFKTKRGISEQTLSKMGVTSCYEFIPPKYSKKVDSEGNKIGYWNNCVHFNYYKDGELTNVKVRGPRKEFWQPQYGCEQVAFNLDGIKNTEDCYIVEGEIDALSLAEIGYTNVVSVPTGAADTTMHWLVDYYEEYFAVKKQVYICVDLDEAGSNLRDNLIKHFDPEQYVLITDFGTNPTTGEKNKDANECLVSLGPDALRKYLANGKSTRPEGDADMDKIGDELDELYNNGLPQGIRIGYPNLDNLMRLEKGRLIIITGTPGSGKSQFLDQVAVKMNVHHEWRFSLFSPEMMPLALHMAMLVSKYTGKPFRKDELNPMTYQRAKERVKDAFHFIDPEDYDLDNILNIARYQVRKYGCDALIIDPWNDLTMDGNGITKTDDINTALLKILTFAQRMNVVVFVMAHPSKIGRNKDGSTPEPTLSDISGSIHFYNRADIGIVVVRTKEEDGREYTKIKIQKMRFANLGAVGETYFKYGVGVGRFHPYDPVGDHTEWDERDLLTPNTTQEAMQFQAAAPAPSEANVSGFLEQAARQEQELKPRNPLEADDDLPFDNDTETPF